MFKYLKTPCDAEGTPVERSQPEFPMFGLPYARENQYHSSLPRSDNMIHIVVRLKMSSVIACGSGRGMSPGVNSATVQIDR